MVKIRLSRGGSKKRPFYHIVATDSRNRRDGRYIEQLGFFNPVSSGQAESLRLDLQRVDYWLGVGAQTSEQVSKLIKQARKGTPLKIAVTSNKPVASEPAPAAAPAATTEATDTPETPPAA